MRSVSPASSTISSQGWQQRFVVTFGQSVPVDETFFAYFSINDTEYSVQVEGDTKTTTSAEWAMSVSALEDAGLPANVGDVVKLSSLYRVQGDDFVKIWPLT